MAARTALSADTIVHADHLVRSVELEVAAHLVEPLLAAVIQGRLHDPAVVALAAALCEKSPIKVSHVHLSTRSYI